MATFRAPANTTLTDRSLIGPKGPNIGGQFMSGAMIRNATYVTPTGSRVTLRSRFPDIIVGLDIRCHEASRQTAEEIRDMAEDLAPTGETGDLKRSLYVVELDLVGDYAVATDIPYAPYVEFGTHTSGPAHTNVTSPHPFLIPATEAHRNDHVAHTVQALQGL